MAFMSYLGVIVAWVVGVVLILVGFAVGTTPLGLVFSWCGTIITVLLFGVLCVESGHIRE